MIVSAVKRAMREHQRATVSQLAAELHQPVELVAAALQEHIRRGRVIVEPGVSGTHCGAAGCSRCPLADACRGSTGATETYDVFVWTQNEEGSTG